MALRILDACEIIGLSVPEQVAIVCRGNNADRCETAPVPLSAIDMNRAEQVRQAVREIIRLSEGGNREPANIVVPPKGFVERRSTDILAVSDPRVAEAMRFMWDHLEWPMSVADVALELNMPRSTLEKAFRMALGRGVHGELKRKRLEACRDLLRTTDMPLAEITKAIGLTSRRHLHRAFMSAFGMTPNQYRKSQRLDA